MSSQKPPASNEPASTVPVNALGRIVKTSFSKNHSPEEFQITPLGAAIVEALPDQRKTKRIVKDFETRKVCPVSELFSDSEVEQFYRDHGQIIQAKVTKS